MLITGCKSGNNNKKYISVSILPVKYFIDRLTEESIEVNVMVPTGADHDTYSPTPQQLKKLSDSKLYVRIGYLGYEQAWIHRLEELNPEMHVLNLSDKVELIHNEVIAHGTHTHAIGIDPHIWMSPKIMKNLIPIIKDAVISCFPELTETVEKNYNILQHKINTMDLDYAKILASVHFRKFMIFHPALTYLARDFNLEQIPIEFEGKEPSPVRHTDIIKQSKEEQIKLIFIQTEYDIRNAKQIAKETGASIVQINPMAYDWIEAMNKLKESLIDFLK